MMKSEIFGKIEKWNWKIEKWNWKIEKYLLGSNSVVAFDNDVAK